MVSHVADFFHGLVILQYFTRPARRAKAGRGTHAAVAKGVTGSSGNSII